MRAFPPRGTQLERIRAVDFETEYNNGRRVPWWPQIAERWAEAAASRRRTDARAVLDVPYGPHHRHRYDLFPASASGPAAVYLHGGYWQEGDRTLYSHLAAPFTDAGVTLAIPSYRLAPEVAVADIIADVRAAVAAIAERLGVSPLLVGHSAGGHLAAAMLATGATSRVVAISGVFDLVPLIRTSFNRALALDEDAAAEVSPARWPPPPPGARFLAVVGEDESAEFHRQARALTAGWHGAGVEADLLAVAGANHFTVIDALADADSALFARVRALAG